MNKNEIFNLIEKIKLVTINSEIIWKRISTQIDIYSQKYTPLRNFINDLEKGVYLYKNEYSSGRINLDESYMAEFLGGYIYLFKYKAPKYGDYVFLAMQSNPNGNLYLMNDFGDSEEDMNNNYSIFVKLSELLIYISQEIDDIKGYMDSILSYENEK